MGNLPLCVGNQDPKCSVLEGSSRHRRSLRVPRSLQTFRALVELN